MGFHLTELKKIVEILKKENSKIPKVKELCKDYRDELKKKDEEIERLKRVNLELYKDMQKIPKFLRKFFIKENKVKMLKRRSWRIWFLYEG